MTSSNRRSTAVALTALSLVGRSYAWGCYIDAYGNERCDGLGYGARVGIAIAIIVLLVLIVFSTFFVRKRRIQRYQQQYQANQQQQQPVHPAYYSTNGTQQQQAPYQPGYSQYYQAPNANYTNYGPDASQWNAAPPPKYEPAPDSTNRKDGVASSPASPYYAPPQGPPPANYNSSANV